MSGVPPEGFVEPSNRACPQCGGATRVRADQGSQVWQWWCPRCPLLIQDGID